MFVRVISRVRHSPPLLLLYTLDITNSYVSCFIASVQLVRSQYRTILQCLPTDYEGTLQVMQDYLTDEDIVLSNSDYSSANKAILDALMRKMSHTGNLLEFCDQLEKIMSLLNDTEVLSNIISEFRASM